MKYKRGRFGRFASIRWRLTLWYVAILAAVLAVFGGIVYASQAQSLRAQQDDALRRQAQGLAAAYDPRTNQFALAAGPQDQLGSPAAKAPPASAATPTLTAAEVAKLEALKRAGSLATPAPAEKQAPAPPPSLDAADVVLLVGPDGEILQWLGPIDGADVKKILGTQVLDGAPRAGDTFFSTALSGQPYQFYTTRVLFKGAEFGTLVLGRPDLQGGQLRRLLFALLVAAPATLLVAAGGGYWLAARAMRPVRAITGAAREIGATDLGRRLNLPNRDELGELAATFDQMLDRLDAAFRRQRQFTSDASHELRTPLTIVQLEVERALAGPLPPAEQARALATIQAENAYMARLVDDLLTLARADAGRATLRREPLDLADLALGVVERLAPLARERGLRLDVAAPPEILVRGDRLYLERLLVNVVENAIKYTAGHGAWVRVAAGICGAGPAARGWVRVTDDGPGIPTEHLPHLGERFYRVDQARARDAGGPGGSGLGLAIARWVAAAHGGDLRITSDTGRGATCELHLPLNARDGTAEAQRHRGRGERTKKVRSTK
ncbi:MAG TPA: ATP-binding protein [Thermomicrobiales bacterium]|nr:ATP-binding protein [Thermomicrobiales bacterium]